MSSTKRGNSRHASDYYVTPVDEIVRFLNVFQYDEARAFQGWILDPCAGGDAVNLMSYPEAFKQLCVSNTVVTADLREDSRADYKGMDYLTTPTLTVNGEPPTLIISNPPFVLAEQFIRKALDDVYPGGFVVMLLRLNFFGSMKRRPFFEQHLPKRAYVHPKRISFTPDGKTDSIEYMHAVWQKTGGLTSSCKLKVL